MIPRGQLNWGKRRVLSRRLIGPLFPGVSPFIGPAAVDQRVHRRNRVGLGFEGSP
jgi:hypothetical protein